MMLPQRPSAKWTMRKKLLCYMLLLAVLLLFALFSGILMIGRFDSAGKSISQALGIRMEVFERDMSVYFEALAADSIDLSRHVSELIEKDSEIAGKSFRNLTDDPEKINALQATLIQSLAQKLENRNCSGIFVILDATVNSEVENAALSRTGLYLLHDRYQNHGDTILFRGSSAVGKELEIMPHRKWRLEFRTDSFPSYDEIAANADLPLSEAYMLTECTTLAGTSDEVVMMAIPITGSAGAFYGICGYEISANYFMTYHVQPAVEDRLACMLLSSDGNGVYTSEGLSCSGQTNYVQPPTGSITVKNVNGDLAEISDGRLSFIGVRKEVALTPNNGKYTLAVMIPKADFNSAVIKSDLQLVVLITLLVFFTLSCCMFFSRHYLSPIMKGLEQIKRGQWESGQSTLPEINDLFDYLAKQDEEHSSTISSMQFELDEAARIYHEAQKKYSDAQTELQSAQSKLRRLTKSRRDEVDPEQYQLFLSGLKTLTATEKTILNYYLDGKTVKDIMELVGIKETTIRFHNRNIYSKLNVNSLKQLLQYAAMMQQSDEDKAEQAL